MATVAEGIRYAERVASGEVLACEYHEFRTNKKTLYF